MKTTLLSVAIALALGLAGCDRNNAAPKQPTSSAPAPSSTAGSSAAPNAPTSNTPTTPANIGGASSQAEKQPPVQGREDVRQPEQRKDFEHKGDGAGPKPGG
jgi:hypothetical protein